MSLLINENIEMPTNCRDCPLNEFRCLRGKSDITMRSMERGRHPDCPLVEVPDGHGRLIDAEYVKEHITACMQNGRPMYAPELYELLAMIDDAPTIITADKKTNYHPPINWCGEEPIASDPAPIKGFDMSKGVLDMQTGTFYPAEKDGE